MTSKVRLFTGVSRFSLAAAALAGPAYANPINDDGSHQTAAVLVVLGVWAILSGVRNLRTMRYKPLLPRRARRAENLQRFERGD